MSSVQQEGGGGRSGCGGDTHPQILISTDHGPGRWGYSPCNLTTIPAGQTEWGMQRAQELTTDVPQNMPARHSQMRKEFLEHGFFSTRSKGHRERSLGTQRG